MAVTQAHLDVLALGARTEGAMAEGHRWGSWQRGIVASHAVRDCAAQLWITVEIHVDAGKHFIAVTSSGLAALLRFHPCHAPIVALSATG